MNFARTLLQFFNKYQDKLIYLLLFSFILLTFFSVNGAFWKGLKDEGDALTSDEVSHIPAGLYYLKTGRYFINPEHPFLIKDIAAFPLLFLGSKIPSLPPDETDNPQWDWGRRVLFYPENNLDKMALFSRLSIILLNVSLLFLVYLYLKKFWGRSVALFFAFLLTFSPTQLAHSSLVTNDTTASFTLLLAIFAFADLLNSLKSQQKVSSKKVLLAAFFVFLTLVTKFSCILILPILFLMVIIYVFLISRLNLKLCLKCLAYLVLVNLITLFLLTAAYAFHTRNMEKAGIAKQLTDNYPADWPRNFKNSLIQSMQIPYLAFFSKGITQYLVGFFMVQSRVEAAAQSLYFMHHLYGSEGAGIKYFPLIYLFKTTPAVISLLLLSLLLCILWFLFQRKIKKIFNDAALLGVVIFFLVYLTVSLTSRFQIGIRHIMPLIFIIYIFIAYSIVKGVKIFQGKIYPFVIKGIVIACLSLVFSNLITFPHYLSYFNFLVGGTDEGYKIATDSNYDWAGQDLKRITKWVKENKIDKIYLQIFTNLNTEYYLGKRGVPFNLKREKLPPAGSLIAVSAFELQDTNSREELDATHKYFQLEDYQIDRIGKTIFVFRVPY